MFVFFKKMSLYWFIRMFSVITVILTMRQCFGMIEMKKELMPKNKNKIVKLSIFSFIGGSIRKMTATIFLSSPIIFLQLFNLRNTKLTFVSLFIDFVFSSFSFFL